MDFLLIIAAIWLAAASFTDIKKREVADWLSFSLVAIALSFRASESIILWSITPISTSLIGLGLFFILANLLYYLKIFAGGDAKLLIAMGTVMPSLPLLSNILIVGSIYGLLYSLFLGLINRKAVAKELGRLNFEGIKYILSGLIILTLIGLALNSPLLYLISGAVAILLSLQIYIGAVDRVSLIKNINPKDLTEGDWLLKNVRLKKGKIVYSKFSGLTKREISLLIKNGKKIYVRYGIPFIPVYFIAFLLTIWLGNLFALLV